jgi:hypothetical protein
VKYILTSLMLLIGLAACNPITLTDDLVITMTNTVSAPLYSGSEYKLAIYADGTVVFDGIRHVKVVGQVTTTVPRERIQALVKAFDQANFFSLRDYACSWLAPCLSGQQTTVISITVNGRTKTIKHNHGDMSTPQTLVELERKILDTVNSDQWLLPASD